MEGIARSEPDLGDSFERFWERLRETIAWCQHNLDVRAPKQSLRTDAYRPRTLEADYFAAVGTVANARLIGCPREVLAAVPARSLEGGRLLVHEPDMDLACGAAEASSRGFFDIHNVPPWDTWVAMVQDSEGEERVPYLVSWVPPQFLDLAQRGIEVNPESCINWLDDVTVQLKRYTAIS
jgi:hypothetical protein